MSTNTLNRSKPSPNGAKLNISCPEEIRRLIEIGKSRGLIRDGRDPVKIEKNGIDLARLENVTIQKVDVTPAMAGYWLQNNFRNRPMVEDVVKAYARDMVLGQWVFTHQGIAFNDQDQLIDGQHRLRAVVMSGVTIPMMVTFGLPSAIDGRQMTTMDCVDRGRTRTVGDQLAIQHAIKNGSIVASICAAMASLCFGERTRRLSVGQTLEVYREFQSAVDFVIAHKSKSVGLRSTGVLAGFVFAMASDETNLAWVEKVAAMFEALNTGEQLRERSAMTALRAFLTSDEAKLITRSLDRGLAELVLQAIHLEILGRTVEKLEMSLDGAEHFKGLQRERVEKIAGLFRLPSKGDLTGGNGGNGGGKPKETIAAPAVAVPRGENGKPSLERILFVVEKEFGVSRLILAGRGTDAEVAWPRAAFVNVAMSYGHGREEIGAVLKRTGALVLMLHFPKSELGPRQLKSLERIRAEVNR